MPAGTQWADLPKVLPATAISPEKLTDAGDFYLTPGQSRVSLLRSATSTAVEFAPEVTTTAGLKKLRARRGVPLHTQIGEVRLRGGRRLQILRARNAAETMDTAKMLAEPAVSRAFPVLVDRKTHRRMILTDELLVRFAPHFTATQITAWARQNGMELVPSPTPNPLHVHCLRIKSARRADPLALCRRAAASGDVVWAQPNFVREIRRELEPANPFFPDQQALANTGQNHAVAGADVQATQAWDRTTGKASTVIAIIDDGVDLTHPALHIFTNPGESGDGKETNGIDDDGDGLIDDVHGWDFANNDNNPTPIGTNGHGTGCAGIAASSFGSGAPTAGIAPGCTILPVKIADDSGDFTTDQIIGDALLYAAHFADVLSNSWGGGSPSPYIEAALDYAATQGRSGKGCPSFFATGNAASTWYEGGGRARIFLNGFGGNYSIGFAYLQGAASGGENAVRVDNVCLLGSDGYTHLTAKLPDEDFEGDVPGWFVLSSFGVTSNWSLSFENALTGTGGFWSAVSPKLKAKQLAVLASPYVALTGQETLAFATSVSIPSDPDAGLYFVLLNASFQIIAGAGPLNGVPDVTTDTTYPASYASAIAVGASTDADLRSDYSEYGGKIDFVAPSNGGWNDIATLDPVGAVGWTAQDYKMNFGGTSAATPLAAGIAALMISENPSLTALEVRTLLHQTCDQIGGVAYDANGRNPLYGYGRVNARRAVGSALPILCIANATVAETAPGTDAVATFSLSLSDPAIREVTVDFSTLDATALAGINYDAANGAVTFPAGSTTQTLNVTVHGGILSRPSASFLVQLANVVSAELVSNPATGKIFAYDSDSDGMPNFWEAEQQLNSSDAADAALDDDGDGFTNAQEFLAGTDPHNTESRPGISQFFADASGFHIQFPTALDRFYKVEFTDDLTGSWQPLQSEIPGTGATLDVIDPSTMDTLTKRFYRVETRP
ncbi:MAG: S8 family serine peptidase [Chthoniobacterales bacterium]